MRGGEIMTDSEEEEEAIVRSSRPSTRPDLTWSTDRIRDAVLSFTNSDTIHFLNKTHFKYSFVKDNCPYENIYVYITLT